MGSPGPSSGVRSPPLRGEARRSAGRLAEKPPDDAKGGFLGGAHSVRPHCEAMRIPIRPITRGDQAAGP